MNTNCLRESLFTVITGLVLMNTVWASTPVWTFAPVSGYPASVNVSPSGTAIIEYIVTNQSHRLHTLKIRPIQGVTSSGCTSNLGYHQSCTLILTVIGSSLKGDVLGGPVLCDQGNPNECYQPSQAHSLAIRLTSTPPAQQYTITVSAGSNGSVNPSGPQTVNSGTSLSFTATPASGYGVSQWLVDGNLVQTGGLTYQLTNITANHIVNVTFGTVTLTPTVSTLGLSVNCPSSSSCNPKNDALTGNPRKIKITNTGSVDATNVVVSHSGLPLDTLVSPSSCGTIAANGGECEITVTPGSIASANASNILCTTGVQPEGNVSATADGGISVSVNTYVLSYGCIYQGGFIYSVDDTTVNTGSIGGKTAAVTDSINTSDWGGFGVDIGPAVGETSIQGANNGSANSAAIISTLTPPELLSDYAAGLCSTLSVDDAGASPCMGPNACYINWYLPALCELGPYGVICTAGSTNIQQQLFENTLIPSVTLGLVNPGQYWSSTESSQGPDYIAWAEHFITGGSLQDEFSKTTSFGVRCSRALSL